MKFSDAFLDGLSRRIENRESGKLDYEIGTITHIARNEGEIEKHGEHMDLIDRTSFGSHQTRIDPEGNISDQNINFSNRHTPGSKVGGYTCGSDGLPIRGYNDHY